MCVILVSPEGQPFDVNELEMAQWFNPDGVGVAWRSDGLIRWAKFSKFDRAKWRQPRGPCIIHFRLATAGGDSVGMAHPFPVSRAAGVRIRGQARQVLFHNGHLFGWQKEATRILPAKHLTKGPPWSDSRLLAYCVHRFGAKHLTEMCKSHFQRVALFDNESLSIYGKWDSTVQDAIMRSNTTHLDSGGVYDDGDCSVYYTRAETRSYSIGNHKLDPRWGEPCGARLTDNGNSANFPVRQTNALVIKDLDCCSLNPGHHEEYWCCDCDLVRCVDCHGWGACLTHLTVRLSEEDKKLV